MNQPIALKSDGLARRLFRVADLDRMVEVGVLEPDERIELVRGELIPMAAKGARHEDLKVGLTLYFGDNRPREIAFAQELGWALADLVYLEPDFVFFAAGRLASTVSARDALLVIEVSDTSLGYDLGIKASIYAELGVTEYWVIDAAERVTHVHKTPTPTGYAERRAYPAETTLTPDRIRGLTLRLADIPGT